MSVLSSAHLTVEDRLDRAFERGWTPAPDLTVSEWADNHRWLSAVASAEHGKWRTSRTPYLREIMDQLSANSPTQEVCFMKAAQIGATEAGLNWIGYVIHHAPGPMLMIQPTLEMLKKVSKQKLAPAITSTPALAERIGPSRERDSGNTLFTKEFPNGILLMTTANSAAGLRTMSIRYLFPDEIDAYADDVGGEGDPIELARKRTATYRSRRKCFYTSTPTNRGSSRIEKMYNKASDRRRFFIPCPECGHMDFLTWSGYADFIGNKDGGHHCIAWDREPDRPETAYMVCGGRGCRIPEHRKDWMLQRGEWRSTLPVEERIGRMPGYHLSALYSLIGQSWAECVAEFLRVKKDPPLFKVWVNTILGESWEEAGSLIIDVDELLNRICGTEGALCPAYPFATVGEGPTESTEQRVPIGVGLVVAAIDVQADRLEWKVIGYGAGEESWPLAAGAETGDPAQEEVWLKLDRQLLEPLMHERGRVVPISAIAVDTRFHSDRAYRFCAARYGRKIAQTFGVRGEGHLSGVPIVPSPIPTRDKSYRAPVWNLCTDTAKERIYARLQIQQPGPGYMHLPHWVNREYLEQLTAEKPIHKWTNGRRLRLWEKKNGRERNEQLDLEVYCLAALHILGRGQAPRDLAELAKELEKPPDPASPPPSPTGVAVPVALLRQQRGNWVTGGRGWKR